MSIFSKHSPPTRLGIIHPPEHDFFDDPSLFLALDDDDDEEDGSIPPQDSSFLPSDDRLHLETAERERLKSMCITFRANPFAFQEINQNGLGRRTTGPPAQPHASPPLLYNFWADSSASPPPTLPILPAGHAHTLIPPLQLKCEEQEPENPLSHPYLQKSPTEWYGIPSSSSTMTNNLQPVALSYGELPSRPQNDQTNSYTSWPPHQAPSARAVYSQSYTPTSSFVPHHLPPMHAYIPTSTTSASASASSGSGSFSPRHFSDDISSTGRAVYPASPSDSSPTDSPPSRESIKKLTSDP
ncbi:hypothetical protein BS47DRAFT_1362185 [Hydnum rufescens UP504]|uniref:Uncharacterized protein n=1 Tax=Hydnum rufescens UP504 TaxID=1448309 RepID=A0A9P6AZV4_9AGAM|nr:hypothetical protein BS47DRAFT_1362185 [Hydnum rufescens UP504]